MGGGGGQQTTSTTPWAGQQPYLTDLFANAQNLFRQGWGQQYYPGQTVAGFAPQTEMALDLTTQRALAGSPQQQAMGQYLTGAMGQPLMDPTAFAGGGADLMAGIRPGQQLLASAGQPTGLGQAAQIAGLGGFAGGAAGGAGEAPGGAALPAATQQLMQTVGGAYMPGANPYLDQVYGTAAQRLGERFQEDIVPGIAATFGAGGRTGSGAQALALGRAAGEQADALAKLGADIYAPAYEAERARQQQAALDMFGTGTQADITRRQIMSDIYTGGLGRQLEAGQALGQLGLGGMGGLTDLYGTQADVMRGAAMLAPSFREMEYGDIGRLATVGGTLEDQAQRLIDAERQRFEFGQQAPWQALGQYSDIVQGMPGGYGTTTQAGGGGNPLLGGLGGAATGAGLAQALAPAAGANPWLAPLIIGGGAAGFLG